VVLLSASPQEQKFNSPLLEFSDSVVQTYGPTRKKCSSISPDEAPLGRSGRVRSCGVDEKIALDLNLPVTE